MDVKSSSAALDADETLKFPTKSSAPLVDMNANSVDDLTTALATELACKHRHTEAVSAAQSERVPGSDLETETEEEDKNHNRTASLQN